MKTLVMTFLLVLLSSTAYALETHLDWSATFAPPHNEPVVGSKVARYRVQVNPSVEHGWFKYSLNVDAWGRNTWQRSAIVGHGLEAWENSDWSVEDWRFTMKHIVTAGPEKFHVFVEYYTPIDKEKFGGHGMEENYYLLTGFAGRIW